MNSNAHPPSTKPSARKVWLAAVAVFFVAFGVRLLMLHDSQVEARKVQSGVAADYQRTAQLLNDVGLRGFFVGSLRLILKKAWRRTSIWNQEW